MPIYRHRKWQRNRWIKTSKDRGPKISKKANDVRRVQDPTIRITHINEGADRASIKGAVYWKTCHFPKRRNPQKRKKSLPKEWPRRRGIVPQTQPSTSPESMHPRLSSLWAVKDRQVTSASRTRVSQPLEVTTRLEGNCYTVSNMEMTWRARDDVEGWLGIWLGVSKNLTGPTNPANPT